MFWILSRISESTTERFWGTGWAGGLHPGEDTIQRQSGRIWRFWLQKTRAFCVNMILQCAARKSSLVICDPKSELYEKTSEYLRSHGYTVRVFNLVTPAASDSWNCLSEIEGQELMAQLFCDVIIKIQAASGATTSGTTRSSTCSKPWFSMWSVDIRRRKEYRGGLPATFHEF